MGAPTAMLCDSRVKNTHGETDVFRYTECTTRRLGYCNMKDIFVMEKATNTEVVDKYNFEIDIEKIFFY